MLFAVTQQSAAASVRPRTLPVECSVTVSANDVSAEVDHSLIGRISIGGAHTLSAADAVRIMAGIAKCSGSSPTGRVPVVLSKTVVTRNAGLAVALETFIRENRPNLRLKKLGLFRRKFRRCRIIRICPQSQASHGRAPDQRESDAPQRNERRLPGASDLGFDRHRLRQEYWLNSLC